MLFFSMTDTAGGYDLTSLGGNKNQKDERTVGLLGRWARRVLGKRQSDPSPPRPTLAPTRSRSSGSSMSFLSRFSSRTSTTASTRTSSISTQLTNPSDKTPKQSPILTLILPHLRILRALSPRASALTRQEATLFVAQLDLIAALHPNIGRDVRRGVEVTFLRGGADLADYLRWVVGEVEAGRGLGRGGTLGSWGWDVVRMLPILSILLHRLTTSPKSINSAPFVAALGPIDPTTAAAVEAICADSMLWREEKIDLVRDMMEDLETTVRMYWEDHTTPCYHLSTFSFYIGPPTPNPNNSRRPYRTPHAVYIPSPGSSRAPSSCAMVEDASDLPGDGDGEQMEWVMDEDEMVEFEMVTPLPTPEGPPGTGGRDVWLAEAGSRTEEKGAEVWWAKR